MTTEFPHTFTLSGVEFRGAHLSPDTSLDMFAILAPALGKVLDQVDVQKAQEDKTGALAEAFTGALNGFTEMRKTAPAFYEVYQVKLEGQWLQLGAMKNEAFKGKPVLMISWLVAAIREEYADFLLQAGWSTLGDLVKACGFQITFPSTGQSGE